MAAFKRKKPVVVLGAGPAGLLAAHAAEERGREVTVYSSPGPDGNPAKSELHGCQYLHASIPGIDTGVVAGKSVRYFLNGYPEDYRRKVYGAAWDGAVSPDEYGAEANHLAWDLRKVYDVLWERWFPRIEPAVITPMKALEFSYLLPKVLCTIPAKSLCRKQEDHKFVTQDVWAMGGPREDFATQRSMPYYAPDMTVECNAHESPRWYRAATVFGHSTLEWPDGPKPPISGIARVQKPLSTDCDCNVGRTWHRLGRYGKWRKGVLVHEAYYETRGML